MGKLTVTTFVSIDGVMQAPGGKTEDTSGGFTFGGWGMPHFDGSTGAAIDDIFSRADAFLIGRGTYDIFYAYWPKMDNGEDIVENKLNRLTKHVASRKSSQFDWKSAEHVADLARDVPRLKEKYQGELQVQGSAGLIQSLLQMDVIDEMNLFVFPVVLGSGKRLFEPGTRPVAMKLVKSDITENGIAILRYKRNGAVLTSDVPVPA